MIRCSKCGAHVEPGKGGGNVFTGETWCTVCHEAIERDHRP